MNSFSFYYYICLPIKLWFERLDLMFFPNYMLPIIFHGKSLVILTEDIYYEMRRSDLRLRYKLAYKIFAGWWAASHATKITAISETSKHELIKLFSISPDRIIVNQLGVDVPKPITYNLEPRTYILYVGQAFPRRHLRETMLAFEQLISQATNYSRPTADVASGLGQLPTTNYQFIVVGKDKYNPPVIEKLKNEINTRLGKERIVWKEYVSEEELAALYAGAKLLVYVSSKEALGLPPLEALSYGVPAVIANQAITREIFGNCAFFVANPDDPNSIAATITEGMTNEVKRQKIKNARMGILEKYTWQKHAEKFLKICKDF